MIKDKALMTEGYVAKSTRVQQTVGDIKFLTVRRCMFLKGRDLVDEYAVEAQENAAPDTQEAPYAQHRVGGLRDLTIELLAIHTGIQPMLLPI